MTDQRLRTRYLRGEIAFGAPNPWRNLCRLCVGLLTTGLNIALVGAGPTLSWFRDFIGDYFSVSTRLRTAALIWGGVMLCIVSGYR